MAKLVDELKELVSAFESNGIEYALCGGLAMAAHGFVRATMDIDILIPEESLEKAYQVGAEKGFDIRGLDISFKERAVEIRRISKVVGEDVISLDLLLVTPQVEEIWKTREKIDFLGDKLSIVSRDGLISMKRLAGRPQDLVDIERLENEAS
ncbi:MAG TPA: hypothetical protein VL327_14555 [Pyrinomonadaceae bacterium]|nr:hypothetical protein [Pyrinomonadaceae bacterium]